MVKVVLVQPDSPWAIDPLASHPALGILYISAYLKYIGNKDVRVVDLTGGVSIYDFFPVIEQADFIGISATTPHFPIAADLRKELFQINPRAAYTIGGPHATVHPQSCLDAGFDYVVGGEGEISMDYLIQQRPVPPKAILNTPVKDLDLFPFPDRDAIDISRYKYVKDGIRYTSMICSRGCYWGKCAFCCQTWPKPARFRSPKNCIKEMELIREKYGFEGIYFYDDCFNLHRPWLRKFCKAAQPLNMKWRCLIRADIAKEQARGMVKGGCVEVFIGQESGSKRILKNINKGITPKQGLEAVRICREAGLHTRVGLIIGLPGESYKTVEQTRRWLRDARKINPELDFDYTICTVYPGSHIWHHPERYDIEFEKQDWSKMIYKRATGSYQHTVSTSSLSSEEIVRLHDEVSREFGEWGLKLAKEKS